MPRHHGIDDLDQARERAVLTVHKKADPPHAGSRMGRIIAEGGADIIIGTQLVAKGHNFPLLTLVGVIDADLGLQGSDLRAAERTFQLMRQVAGRAGRAERPGAALLQTFQPEHPVIRAILSGDEEGFWNAESDERRQAGVPPFGRMAGIVLSSTDMQEAFDVGEILEHEDVAARHGPGTADGPGCPHRIRPVAHGAPHAAGGDGRRAT